MLILASFSIAAQQAPTLLFTNHILQTHQTPEVPNKGFVSAYPSLWQPSAAEAARAKVALYRFLAADRRPLLKWDKTPLIKRARPSDYEIQYLGTHINIETGRFASEGTRILVIHAVRRDMPHLVDDLDYTELVAMDGGDSFFDAYYDVQNDRLLMFSFHGLA